MGTKKLPILGNVSLPVRIMHYQHKEDKNKFFQSGFSFFRVADDQADVSDNDGNEMGTLGGCMGGQYLLSAKREKDDIQIIISVEDIWNEITKMFENADVKIKLEGIEEIYKKYWDQHLSEQAQEKRKEANLEEIKQMQREAEQNAKQTVEDEIDDEDEDIEEDDNEKSYRIISDGGWDLEQTIPKLSDEVEEDFIFDPEYATNVKIIDNDGTSYVTRSIYNEELGVKPKVSLEINTWKGMSVGAIHYYGTLIIDQPQFYCNERETIRSYYDIPFFNNRRIELTHLLEQWEIDRYPDNYEYNHAGQWVHGFYTEKHVKMAAQEFFDKHFDSEKWQLIIEER